MEFQPSQEPQEAIIDFSALQAEFSKFEILPITEVSTPPEILANKTENYRIKLETAYQDFGFPEIIDNLRDEIESYDKPRHHPDFIDEGVQSAVFSVHGPDDEHYVARFPEYCSYNKRYDDIEDINKYIDAFKLGEGVKGLEQAVAASTDENVIISQFIPGNTVDGLTKKDYLALTADHVQSFIDTVQEVTANDVNIDVSPGNFIFNEQDGFTVIDYKAKEEAEWEQFTPEAINEAFFRDTLDHRSKIYRLNVSQRRAVFEEIYQGIDASSLGIYSKIDLIELICRREM